MAAGSIYSVPLILHLHRENVLLYAKQPTTQAKLRVLQDKAQ